KDLFELSDGNRVSAFESDIYMEHQLLKDTDFMSMWFSIEVRVPFLDNDFIKTVQKISSRLKFEYPRSKYLLIESFKDILPREIWDRKKLGFQFPFAEWMKDSLDTMVVTNKDQKVRKQFKNGKIEWSRYWAYLISQSFEVS